MLGKRKNYLVNGNKICFTFEKGEAYIEILRKDIVNVFVPLERNIFRRQLKEIKLSRPNLQYRKRQRER